MKIWAIVLVLIGVGWTFVPAPSTPVAARTYPQPRINYARTESTPAQPSQTTSVTYPVTTEPAKLPVKTPSTNALRLQGIFYGGAGRSTALIGGQTVSVGDKVGNLTVSAIDPQSVTLHAVDGKETALKLPDIGR